MLGSGQGGGRHLLQEFAQSKAGGLCAVEVSQEAGGSLRVGFGKRQRAEDDLPSSLKLRNLARQASSLSLEIGEGPADRDRLHDSDSLALHDVVSRAHEYFGYPSLES